MIKMAFNWIKILFSFMTLAIFIVGGLISQCEEYMPNWVRQSFCYGKFSARLQQPIVRKIEVPKRWFQHLYLFAVPLSTTALCLAVFRYFCKMHFSEVVYSTLDFVFGTERKALVSPPRALLALTLLTVHCVKRMYETQCVSVFSDAKMNISHYLAGYIHYASVIIAILGESEGFIKDSAVNFRDSLKIVDWLAAIVFLGMSYEQLKTNLILANIRKNENGDVVTKAYKIPTGRLFTCISNPLQFTEIVMYAMLLVILHNNFTYLHISIWVLVNQFLCALLSHQWYKKTFRHYPHSRKIIIPYLL